jgi:hypothetical protein
MFGQGAEDLNTLRFRFPGPRIQFLPLMVLDAPAFASVV